ncbi:MAG: biotin/lipoyl-binding protein [Chloroflexi bacterium]|nr:biotin/lipoyl-binding protein [Chloroflexota bacterium]
MEFRYRVGERLTTVRVERSGEVYRISIDGAPAFETTVIREDEHTLRLQVNGKQHRIHIARDGQRRFVSIGSSVFELLLEERGAQRRRASADSDEGDLRLAAHMPGQVVAVAVRDGDQVTKGQTLVILEAMKMELRMQAPRDGTVKRVLVQQGQAVERGQQLIELSSEQ